ncbi:MAG: NAD(P)H-dependent flavin oxidoreductase, partial [Aeromonas veronii]
PYYAEFGVQPPAVTTAPSRAPFNEDHAAMVAEFRPAVVSFHFGLPAPELLVQVKAAGAKVFASATTVAEAVWLAQHGADAIIAQGLEAGGHRGHFLSDDLALQQSTLTLLAQILAVTDLPVIAAGGIVDGKGIANALAMGASAVQMGTAFLCCHEATTSALHRAAIHSPEGQQTALTNLFSGRPARGIVNRLMRELEPLSDLAPHFPYASGALAPLRAAAEKAGDSGFSPLWAGQNVSGCRDLPAGELIACWVKEAGLG